MNIKKNIFWILFFAILLLSTYLRTFESLPRFYYAHDHDLASWIVKDMLIGGHPRLIGQLTSSPGIFIGGLFYYLLAPIFVFSGFTAASMLWFSYIIGFLATVSSLILGAKLHGKKFGIIFGSIYASSWLIVTTERDVVPTTLVFLWSIWMYYAVVKKKLSLSAILIGLVWHIHLVLGALLIIVGVDWLSFKNKPNLLKPILIGVLVISPFLYFEARHNFQQTKSLFSSFGGEQRVKRNLVQKVTNTWEYFQKNTNSLIWEKPGSIPAYVIPLIVLMSSVWLLTSSKISKREFAISTGWIALFIGIFTLHPINLSEYYLNSLNIPVLIIICLTLARHPKSVGVLILYLLIVHNIYRLHNWTINKSGFLEKNAIIKLISDNAFEHGFPCVAISYITAPGYNLGYRYFIWQNRLKLAHISKQVPVYSIVYPQSIVDHLDRSAGAIGLIYPDFSKLDSKDIIAACKGPDTNVTDSMFGFTK